MTMRMIWMWCFAAVFAVGFAECSAWSNTAKKPGKPATPGGWKVQ